MRQAAVTGVSGTEKTLTADRTYKLQLTRLS